MYKLYGSPSTAGTAIHWMLLELDVPFEAVLLDIVCGHVVVAENYLLTP